MTQERAQEMAADFADLPLNRYPMLPFQARVLALRHNLTACDGFCARLITTAIKELWRRVDHETTTKAP